MWAANPALSATQVATILKQTASGNGSWSATLGFGILNVGAAVQLAPTVAPDHAPAAQTLLP